MKKFETLAKPAAKKVPNPPGRKGRDWTDPSNDEQRANKAGKERVQKRKKDEAEKHKKGQQKEKT